MTILAKVSEPVIIGDATLYLGDCIEVMAELPENSVTAIVCDPPYLLNFMGKAFDQQHKALPGGNEGQKMQAWHARWVAEAFRILKPGGHLAAFGGDRSHHRLLAAMEDAGFEMRQNVYWAFGSGFPKSQDAGKALDRKAGAAREVVGKYARPDGTNREYDEWKINSGEWKDGSGFDPSKRNITAPATEAAKKWAGFKTALKPAVEPICVGRKPMIGTLAENLLAWGCGAVNVDGCRVDAEPWHRSASGTNPSGKTGIYGNRERVDQSGIGRFPAHLLHDGSPEVVAMFPQANHKTGGPSSKSIGGNGIYGGGGAITPQGYGDTGSAARFFQSCPYDAGDFDPLFYSGKAAKKDRDEGCGELEERSSSSMPGRRDPDNAEWNTGNNVTDRFVTQRRNIHVSVKPTSLMRWLVRLFTPPGETVLDPFMGSGSTLKAALLENTPCIGIEMDPEYFAIAVERIKHVSQDCFTLESP